jgi:hypothetical protein
LFFDISTATVSLVTVTVSPTSRSSKLSGVSLPHPERLGRALQDRAVGRSPMIRSPTTATWPSPTLTQLDDIGIAERDIVIDFSRYSIGQRCRW